MRIAIIAAAICLASPALAQERVCAPYAAMRDYLKSAGERPVSRAFDGRGLVAEAWVSDERGTWTWVLVDPVGVGCMVAAGESWEPVPAAADEVEG